jgi:L-fuconolactonase
LTEAGPRPDAERVSRYVEHLLSCFGPKRLLWGSDWPVLELAADYQIWHAMAKRMVPEPFHADVFEQTALVAYARPNT